MRNTEHRRELLRLLAATAAFGAAGGIFAATLNNFLAEVHGFGAEARGWLEFPRELPGFLLVGVTGLLALWMRESKMAALAMLASALGALGLARLSPNTALVVTWVAIWSLGDHILFAVDGPLGLKLAREGGEGRRLGQLGGARNLGTISGVGLIYLLAKLGGNDYPLFYLLAGGFPLTASVFYFSLRTGQGERRSRGLVVRREYGLFYAAYVLDNLLFALRVARTTYLKKIARDPEDITPSISLGITIDHAVAMTLPVLSGYLWEAWGYRWVFLIAAAIALLGFFVCLRIRVPARAAAPSAEALPLPAK
ncbi:MFS transporter [bacterium]|nr:MFS transporter [bacterium]